jgi:hypothetical protein
LSSICGDDVAFHYPLLRGCPRVPWTRGAEMLRQFGKEMWTADGPSVSVAGFVFPTRTIVIRLSDGALFVWSPIALPSELKVAIDCLGPVRHIVAPNRLHHMFVGEWQSAYPAAIAHFDHVEDGQSSTPAGCAGCDGDDDATDARSFLRSTLLAVAKFSPRQTHRRHRLRFRRGRSSCAGFGRARPWL